jgi:O-antigen/teichoic acid export membrane protein
MPRPPIDLQEEMTPKSSGCANQSMKTASSAHTEKTILAEASMLASSRYLFQAIAMVRGFIIATVLGPALYGFWTLIMTCFVNTGSLGLGALNGMVRQVPLNKGRGSGGENLLITQTCLTWMIVISSSIALCVLLATYTTAIASHRPEIRLACLVLIVYAVWVFVLSKLAGERKIGLLSRLNVVYGILNALFGISLLFVLGIKGLLLGMLLAAGTIIGWLVRQQQLSLKPMLDRSVLFRLMGTGFPIMILNMTFVLVRSIDKFIVFFLLGATDTGYFGLASFIGAAINYIPGALSVVIFPRAMHVMGATNDRQQIEKYYFKPVLTLTRLIPVLLGLIYINIDLPVLYLLPHYVPSIGILKVFILGLFFFSAWGIPRDILVAFNKQKQLLASVISLFILVILTDILVVHLGFGILGVAMASIVVLAANTLIANTYLLWCLKRPVKDIVRFLVSIYSPFFYTLFGLLTISHFIVHDNLLLQNIAQTITFIIFMTPLLYLVEKSTGFARKLLMRKLV